MKKVNRKHISTWLHKNARELELAIWKYHFGGGNKEDVVKALAYYQNEDGGFGNGVDPDNWNVNSLPYATLFVIHVLEEIEFYDMEHPIYTGIKRYLDTGLSFPDGWNFTVVSNGEFPHASYYNYEENYNRTESIGIILGLSTFIIEHYQASPIYPDVLSLAGKMLDKLSSENLGDMGPSGFVMLVKAMRQANIDGYDYDNLEMKLKDIVNNSIQRKPEQWLSYGYRPSDYIKTKESIFYEDNKAVIELELDFLCDTLPENDVWPIPWSWFENNEKYPRESVISGNWYKSIKAIEKARFLEQFMRLQ